MTPTFLADADFNQKIVSGLRRREPSVDIATAKEGGILGLSDFDVLLTAARTGRVLLSHDRRTMPSHFAEFIRANECPGVLLFEQRVDIGDAIEEILMIWAGSSSEEWRNRLVYLPL